MDTKTKILDVAEKLIAECTPKKASLRKITEEAGVNVAAINYHFGSKDNMVSAIMERNLNPIFDEIRLGLEDLTEKALPSVPRLEDALRCYLIPLLKFSIKNPDYKQKFIQLINTFDDRNIFRHLIRKISLSATILFGETIAKILPEIPRETVLLRVAMFRNMATAIMYGDYLMEETLDIFQIDHNRESILEEMIKFASAGLRSGSLSMTLS